MRWTRPAFWLTLGLAPPLGAAAAADAFLAMQGSAAGALNYARLADIQVFVDASPSRCSVFLANGEQIKAFQTCASITAHINHQGLVTLASPFGAVLLAPDFVTSLVSVASGGCRLNLQSRVWVPVTQSCREVIAAVAGQ